MSFIKIGYGDNGKLLHTLCNGRPGSTEFFFTNERGICQKARDPIAIEFSQENLKKIVGIFSNSEP